MPRVYGYEYQPYGAIPAGIENITPSDTNEFEGVKGFIADTSGTVSVEMEDGSTGTIPVVGGLQYACAARKFKSTGNVNVTALTIFY